jgi:hypothetical protein
MRSWSFRLVFVLIAASALAASSAYSRADGGGPSPGVSTGWDGVLSLSGKVRYVAIASGTETAVAQVRVRDGRVVRYGWLRGSYGIPRVAYDGSAGGLSHDGRLLVLATQPNAVTRQTVTRFATFDLKRFQLRKVVALRGAFSFDALSPDASTLYLIQYTSARNYLHYLVRAYDLRAGLLLPAKIADRREAKDQMSGSPVTRTTSADGAWVYTLYQNPSGKPFVHALDAVHRSAVCIDLPWVGKQDNLYRMRLRLSVDERRLMVVHPGQSPAMTIDTRTFAVS